MKPSIIDLHLRSGRVQAVRTGSPDAPLVIFLHGLSAHLHSFDDIVAHLADQNLQLLAVDLRGRGRSEITPAGTYGIDAHSRDVLEIADQLGADQFDVIGWSMGALIGIGVASRARHRVRKLVLIDHAGKMDDSPVAKIIQGLNRLDVEVDQPANYVDAIRLAGSITPWTPFWDNYYHYELGPLQQGYKPTTSKAACLEDLQDLLAVDFNALWKNLCMPTLLIRCLKPVADGFIVPASERDAIRAAVPTIQIEEFEFDHYKIMESAEALRAIKSFLA